jgi:hypothetical protein
MQTTADFHHHVAKTIFPQSDGIFDNPTAFNAADNVFGHNPAPRHSAIVRFLLRRELFASRFLDRPGVLDARQFVSHESQIIDQFTAVGQGIGRRVGNRLIMHTALIGVALEQDQQRVDQQHILQRVALFLATITAPLFIRVFGPWDGAFTPIVKKGVVTACSLSALIRWRTSARLRDGRSPRLARAVRSAGSNTCIH